MIIDIEENDLNEIKMRDGLATDTENTFISLTGSSLVL